MVVKIECVWAGYGGAAGYTIPFDPSVKNSTCVVLKKRVASDYRMTSMVEIMIPRMVIHQLIFVVLLTFAIMCHQILEMVLKLPYITMEKFIIN